jgi:hypothetical protein
MLAKEQAFPFAAGPLATTNQPCWDNLGIVEDKKIARRKEVGKIAEMAMIHRQSAIDHEQARRIAFAGRLLSVSSVGNS